MRIEELIESCRAVAQRATQTLKIARDNNLSLLTIALDHLTLGRAALYEALLTQSAIHNPQSAIEPGRAALYEALLTQSAIRNPQSAIEPGRAALYEAILTNSAIHNPQSAIELAVSGLRSAGQQQFLPLGLLTRAWLRALTGRRTGAASAVADLDEAWEIAARGSMRLFQADILLMRARLFGLRSAEENYPWESPQADLAAARTLIEQCGYGRRLGELEDAELALRDAHNP